MHPEVSSRSCEDCQKWVYNHATGERVLRMGLPILRKPGEPTPCRLPIGCPKGTPEDSKALTEKNAMAYRHYLQCKATGNFPKDEIVALHAGIIRSIEDDIAQGRAQAMASFMRAKL